MAVVTCWSSPRPRLPGVCLHIRTNVASRFCWRVCCLSLTGTLRLPWWASPCDEHPVSLSFNFPTPTVSLPSPLRTPPIVAPCPVHSFEPVDHYERATDTAAALAYAHAFFSAAAARNKTGGFKIRPRHIRRAPSAWRALVRRHGVRVIWQYVIRCCLVHSWSWWLAFSLVSLVFPGRAEEGSHPCEGVGGPRPLCIPGSRPPSDPLTLCCGCC